jgi:hypothetical protein
MPYSIGVKSKCGKHFILIACNERLLCIVDTRQQALEVLMPLPIMKTASI